MKFKYFFRLLLGVCILLSPVASFYPNRLGLVELDENDHTLEEITEMGILLAVAEYFESNPLDDRPSLNPGDLSGLQPLTASTLYSAYYGEGNVLPKKFEASIQDIVSENTGIATKKATEAHWHMNGEKLKEGNDKIKTMRASLNGVLDDTIPEYDVARLYIGRILHITQMFYSNTDWLEMKIYENYLKTKQISPEVANTYAELGIDGQPFLAVADAGEKTCVDCERIGECFYNRHSVITGPRHTSGYLSGQDVDKPEGIGKCSQGGEFDETRHTEAKGGINKQTSDSSLSPHYYYHQDAARLAVEATKDFFIHPEYGLLKMKGEEHFRNILNLGTGASLAMAIDDTGSMSEEIASVIQKCIDVVNRTYGTVDSPYNYVVVKFNDPEFGPAFVTSDPDECIEYLRNISVHGGGDCPEMSLSGVELALINCLPYSDVLVFTDADAKDDYKATTVATLAKEKNSQVKFILTGSCSGRRRRGIEEATTPYELIAQESGGAVYEGSKDEIEQLVNLLDINIGAALVYIAKNEVTRSNALQFEVDDTLATFTITVSSQSSNTSLILYIPSGDEFDLENPNVTVNVDTTTVWSATVATPERGKWVCAIDDSQRYDVEVTSQSPVDFQYNFIAIDATTGFANSIDGSPITGAELVVHVKVFGVTYITSVDDVELLNRTGGIIKKISLSKVPSVTHDTYSATFTVPSETFSVSLRATDKSGNTIRRLQPTTISPETFKLVQLPSDSDELIPGSYLVTKFKLIYTGEPKLFNIVDAITGGGTFITSSISPSNVTASNSSEGNFTHILYATSSAPIGKSVTVTVIAEDPDTTSFNYIVFSTSINAASTQAIDDTLPTLTNSSGIGICSNDRLARPTCSDFMWANTYEFTDDTAIGPITFHPPIDIDQLYSSSSGTTSSVTLNGTCCCPLLSVTVVDLSGNSITVSANLTEPDAPTAPCLPPEPTGLPPGAVAVDVATTNIPTEFDETSPTTKDTDPNEIPDGSETKALSNGAIAGIAVALLVLICVVIVVIVLTMRKKTASRASKKTDSSQELEKVPKEGPQI